MYDRLFDDRDPVAEPGTATGTPGNWWTVFALVPDVLQHAVRGFGLYAARIARCRPGAARAGPDPRRLGTRQPVRVLAALQVVPRRSACRRRGSRRISSWQVADCFTPVRAGRAGVHRLPGVSTAAASPTGVFDGTASRTSPTSRSSSSPTSPRLYEMHAVMSRASAARVRRPRRADRRDRRPRGFTGSRHRRRHLRSKRIAT